MNKKEYTSPSVSTVEVSVLDVILASWYSQEDFGLDDVSLLGGGL